MGCRQAVGHLGLGAQLPLLRSCWHGHEKLSPLGNCAPGKPVPLLGLSLLIYEMSRLDQVIFEVSLGPGISLVTYDHYDSDDGIVVDGRGAMRAYWRTAASHMSQSPWGVEVALKSGRYLGGNGT